MKFLIFLFCTIPLCAQMNPDGYIGGVSLHLKPYITSGSFEQFFEGEKFAEEKYSAILGVSLIAAIPVSKSFTISGFYESRPMEDEYYDFIYRERIDIKGSMNYYGIKLSFYFGKD